MDTVEAAIEADGPWQGDWRRESRLWLLALVLLLPASLPYVAHYLVAREGKPTGFIQLEMPYYLANAREHFDDGSFHAQYGNPYSARIEPKRIYFQPQTLSLALVWRATGWSPGTVFVVFGFVWAWVCMRLVIALYARAAGLEGWARKLGLVLFAWGGGLLAIGGYLQGYLRTGHLTYQDHLLVDPFAGWWFLNLGRNLILPMEAYYHALFFGTIASLIARRYRLAVLLAGLSSISHPFTGIELLLVVGCWAALERWFLASGEVPRWFLGAIMGLTVFHFAYYMVYLGSDPEHRELAAQWALPWNLDAIAFVPAYLLVGLLAGWGLRRFEHAREMLSVPRNRLFLVWFLVAFTLANHEFAVRPVQPLHFTRGYIWTPLFLLGATSLCGLLAALPRRLGRVAGGILVTALALVFLADNAIWLSAFPVEAARGRSTMDVRLTPTETALFERLDQDRYRDHTLICREGMLSFLASTYTPLHTWRGHGANTPFHGQRTNELMAFYDHGKLAAMWRRRPLLVLLDPAAPPRLDATLTAEGASLEYRDGDLRLYRLEPPDELNIVRKGNRRAVR